MYTDKQFLDYLNSGIIKDNTDVVSIKEIKYLPRWEIVIYISIDYFYELNGDILSSNKIIHCVDMDNYFFTLRFNKINKIKKCIQMNN